MDQDYVETVLDVVETIPPGRVATYGDIATAVGHVLERGGPRQVGAALREAGGAVPWWRVVNARGEPPAHHRRRALDALRAEGCALVPGGDRVQLARARFALDLPRPAAPSSVDGRPPTGRSDT